MGEVDVYVVRIYRRGADAIVGVVECVAGGEQLPFHAMQELWNREGRRDRSRSNLLAVLDRFSRAAVN